MGAKNISKKKKDTESWVRGSSHRGTKKRSSPHTTPPTQIEKNNTTEGGKKGKEKGCGKDNALSTGVGKEYDEDKQERSIHSKGKPKNSS